MVNKLSSTKQQLPFPFYTLPFCAPDVRQKADLNLGQILAGDEIEGSLYELYTKYNEYCKVSCTVRGGVWREVAATIAPSAAVPVGRWLTHANMSSNRCCAARSTRRRRRRSLRSSSAMSTLPIWCWTTCQLQCGCTMRMTLTRYGKGTLTALESSESMI